MVDDASVCAVEVKEVLGNSFYEVDPIVIERHFRVLVDAYAGINVTVSVDIACSSRLRATSGSISRRWQQTLLLR